MGVDLNVENKQLDGVDYYELDATNKAKKQKIYEAIIKKYGAIDVLVNNAGVSTFEDFEERTEEAFDWVVDVNLKGVFNMTQFIAPIMIKKGKGSIISTSSIVGVFGNIGQTNYAATKGGVISMTKTWAKEFSRKGAQVRSNAIAPGFIKTPMTEAMPEKILNSIAEKVPLKRMGEVEDIANAALFLASDESSYINGQVLGVDGGLVI